MHRFHVIDDAAVILRCRGVFRQAKVYRRDQELYAGHGNGFVALLGRGTTSVPDMSWLDLDVGTTIEVGPFGRPIAL